MPDQNTDAAAKLKKLGDRLRQNFARQNPIPQRSLDTVREAVRGQWEREQTATRKTRGPSKSRQPRREGPEHER